MRRWPVLRWLPLVVMLALAGCGSTQAAIGSPTPSSVPTATPIIIVVVVTATPQPPTATPAPLAIEDGTPTPVTLPSTTAKASVAPATSTAPTTFRLCPTSDPATERAIEQFIDGRSFRATLSSGPDGCDQLVISPEPGPRNASGRQSVSLSTDGIQVQIVTDNGVTHVSTSPV